MTVHAWLEPFDASFRSALLPWLEPFTERRVACFDADGTLWSEDIGEAFFRWLIAGNLLPRVAGLPDAYAEYERRVDLNRSQGYAWAVQCMAGLSEADVTRWARQLAAAWPNQRPAMAGLARGLAACGYEVWIVSASNTWVVREGAPSVGVERERVIGMGVEVQDGVLTDRSVLPLICREGKVEAIRQRFGDAPYLAFGDSVGDLEMLEASAQPFVIGRHDKPGVSLLGIARERGWPVQLF